MLGRHITIDVIVISIVNRYMTIDGFVTQKEQSATIFNIIFQLLLSKYNGLTFFIEVVNSKICNR